MSELAYEMGLKAGHKEVLDAMPDAIDIYRVIKRSGARKHFEIAKAIAESLAPNPAPAPEATPDKPTK